jgi:hypothetical protein
MVNPVSPFSKWTISVSPGNTCQSGRGIEIAARPMPVGRRAADHFVIEKEKVLDRRGYRIERGLALPRGEPDFEDTFLARQRYRLSELRSNCGVSSSLGSLRPASRDETCKRQQHCESTCKQAKQTVCVKRVTQ